MRSRLVRLATHQGCKRGSLALGLSLLLSTQVLFQANVFQYFSIVETLESMWLYFLDILVIAAFMVCAVSWVDWKLPVPSKLRNFALLASISVSVLLGIVVSMMAHYGKGPYPPEGYLMGEAVRWILAGGAMIWIYETRRRHEENVRQLHAAELLHEVLNNQMMLARINMIEAQIEPHFLFNTLATVKRLYRTEPVDGAHVMARLKAYLQAALPQIRSGLPTLASELELVRNYLEIMTVRMGARLEFSIDAPAQPRTIPLPAMLLVTLVENAIKHGLNPSVKGGRVVIKVFDLPDKIAMEVRDNGVGFQMGAVSSGSGIGLANIRSGLKALYGANASLVLLQNDPEGIIARVEVSKQTARIVALQTANSAASTLRPLQGRS
jgi:sensor histidine kinase YesM